MLFWSTQRSASIPRETLLPSQLIALISEGRRVNQRRKFRNDRESMLDRHTCRVEYSGLDSIALPGTGENKRKLLKPGHEHADLAYDRNVDGWCRPYINMMTPTALHKQKRRSQHRWSNHCQEPHCDHFASTFPAMREAGHRPILGQHYEISAPSVKNN